MEGLTKKERLELESVFAAIYTKKESKFIRFYKEFYHILNSKFKRKKTKKIK